MPDVLPKLAYARDGSTRARTWARRIMLLAWAVLTAYLAYDKWGVPARLQIDLLQSQSRCLSFVEPKGRVIFETEDARFPGLLREQGYAGIPEYSLVNATRLGAAGGPAPAPPQYVAVVSTLASAPLQTFRAARDALDQWDRSRRPTPAPAVALSPNDWVAHSYGIGPDAMFTVMTQRRRAPGRPERLVTVDGEWYAFQNRIAFHAHVIAPAPAFGRAEDLSGGGGATAQPAPFNFPMPVRPDARWVRLYAGQPDPDDAARFTWDYETPAGNGTFEGRLRADDAVDLRAVSGPAVDQPPPP